MAVVVTRWWNQFMSIPWPDRWVRRWQCDSFKSNMFIRFIYYYPALNWIRWFINWIVRMMTYVTTMIEGCDEHGRLIRRTLMRYLTLASLIVYQATSVSVKKRFPTIDHLMEAGELMISALTDFSDNLITNLQFCHTNLFLCVYDICIDMFLRTFLSTYTWEPFIFCYVFCLNTFRLFFSRRTRVILSL